MKYRGFILSVLEETMEANKKGQSIDKAIQPFKNSNDTIELAVLSCVMSEKFRSNVRADHTWMEMAQSMLEELVINLLNGETDEEKEDTLGRRRKYQQGSDEDLSSIESGELSFSISRFNCICWVNDFIFIISTRSEGVIVFG